VGGDSVLGRGRVGWAHVSPIAATWLIVGGDSVSGSGRLDWARVSPNAAT
jgi:hypothetical protein